MIQRIQSVLLAFIFVLMLVVLFLPLYTKSEQGGQTAILTSQSLTLYKSAATTTDNIVKTENVMYLGGLAILSAAISAFSLFSYKNRKLQLWLGFTNTFIIAGFIGLEFYISGSVLESMVAPKLLGSRMIGFYLPLVALMLNFSANRMIRGDENLVRSMDRIR
jgi:hypothetical protein